ncbi:MAG: M23 family metallopeptidase, partial [Robiginitalea sp.]|uniref:M23 family metallopeptidase n=1 Tax=Robiginitalea sp. TaxID=1902411 RepID=UPI003C756750
PRTSSSTLYYVTFYNPPNNIDAGPDPSGGPTPLGVCPDGQIKDSYGRCVDLPCISSDGFKADPLAEMEILGTKKNGIKGARYGYGRGRFHDGIDLKGKVGTPVFSMFSGRVDNSPYSNSHIQGEDWSNVEDWDYDQNGAGNRVYITTTIGNDTYQFGYWHLSKVLVGPGDYIIQGQIIGYMGTTGNANSTASAGPHLHLRGRKNGARYNPEESFAAELEENGQNSKEDCNN